MRDHLYALDVLRFCAAFAVMVFHLCFYGWASDASAVSAMFAHVATFEPLAPLTWFGWVGVEVFFVISGFVIANSANGAAPAAFFKGRVLRLYPAVWICACVSLAAWLLVAHEPFAARADDFLRAVTLWISGPWIDGVYWSLAVEIVFYALVFGVLVARRFVSLAAIPWLLTGLTLIYQTFFGRFRELTVSLIGERLTGWIEWRHEIMLLQHGALFAVGVWLWMLSRRRMTPLRYAGLGVAFLASLVEIRARVQSMPIEVSYEGKMSVWPPVLIWLFAVGVVAIAALRPAVFRVGGERLQSVLKRVGLMTYPLFLIHSVAGAALMRALITNGVNPWLALSAAMGAALVFAYFVCAYAEVAVRAVLRAALDRGERFVKMVAPRLDWLFAPGRDSVLG